jgi:hypothetical protein
MGEARENGLAGSPRDSGSAKDSSVLNPRPDKAKRGVRAGDGLNSAQSVQVDAKHIKLGSGRLYQLTPR